MRTYIVGTDTDAGKTFFGQKLMREGKRIIKPIETGYKSFDDLSQSDCHTYAIGQGLPLKEVNLYFFSEPASPHYASLFDGIVIDIKKISDFICQHKEVTIELAGGLMVPIVDDYTQLDLIKNTPDAQVILVVGNKLGCINHALLTLEILKSHQVKVSEVVINNFGQVVTPLMENNIQTIRTWVKNNTKVSLL